MDKYQANLSRPMGSYDYRSVIDPSQKEMPLKCYYIHPIVGSLTKDVFSCSECSFLLNQLFWLTGERRFFLAQWLLPATIF